jgi:aminopeptidase N
MKFLQSVLFTFLTVWLFAQNSPEELRGGNGVGRNWWNLEHYNLSVDFDIVNKQISGNNQITLRTIEAVENPIFQLDLQEPMILDSIFIFQHELLTQKIIPTTYRNGNVYLIPLKVGNLPLESQLQIKAYFHGSPRQAKNPPWDGGIVWSKDKNKMDWVSIACQGLGASVWFPCKDSQADEPEQGVETHFTCPSNLVCVSNGNLTSKIDLDNQRTTYSRKVINPINNYCIIPYIGDYVSWKDPYQGEKGTLDVEYWVLRENEEKAKIHFVDVHRTLKAFEYWFGPYPFYEDGFKLIEAPYLGMEHQSAIAYGNKFKKGYLGSDLSGTGVGMEWDYIIVHEMGHEWFGNNITSEDIADMWIHESFTTYSETLFTEYWQGKSDADNYCIGQRKNCRNDKPIIGKYGLNEEGSGDMYYKGANMLHTIRTIVGNDTVFREMLREMNAVFYHKVVTTKEIEAYMSQKLQLDLAPIFDQYLRTSKIPILVLKEKKRKACYRWENCVDNFNMPIVTDHGNFIVTTKWTTLPTNLNRSSKQYYKVRILR